MIYEKNIKTYYFYSTFTELLILGPIIVLYLIAKGLSFTEVMLLQSISALAIVLFEVPTGAVADKYGRKFSVLLGSIMWIVSLSLYIAGNSFLAFVIAEVLFSIGMCFKSGADNAIIYDSLKLMNREKEYSKVEGRARSLALYSQAVGSVIAGFVYEVNIHLPMLISIGFILVTIVATLMFKEPPTTEREEQCTKKYIDQITDSAKYIISHDKLKAIVLFTMVFFAFYRAGFWYFQPYMEAVAIPVKYFGIIFFVFNIVAALASRSSHSIMEKTKPRTLTFMGMLLVVSFVLLGLIHVWAGVAAILLQQVARGIYRPITTKYLNKHIPSEKRATVLSFCSLCTNLSAAAVLPLMGIVKDHTDIFITHLLSALIMLILMLFTMSYMNKKLCKK